MKKGYLALLLVFSLAQLNGQGMDHKMEEFQLLNEFLQIPNNSLYPEHIRKNLDWLKVQFEPLGFETQELLNKGNPLFFAQKIVDPSLPTVLFYMHFDGQPVDTSAWFQENPYKPVLKRMQGNQWKIVQEDPRKSLENLDGLRIFARSSSDDKGPIAMMLAALKRNFTNKKELAYNVKVILDSEEEVGSPHLPAAVDDYKDLLSADFLLVFDGPMHDSGLPTLTYGVRGITTIKLIVYGSERPQHSGHYGNYAPNPVFRAAHILNSMKDSQGKVLIPGYYKDVRWDTEAEQVMARVPDDPEQLNARAGFKNPEKVGKNYQEAMQYPSLNVRGIRSGWVNEEARTIVPDKTIVEMDIRTVPETSGDRLAGLVKNHLLNLGYDVLDEIPKEGDLKSHEKPVYFSHTVSMNAFRTPLDHPVATWLNQVVTESSGQEVVHIRIGGGSLPLSFFIDKLDMPAMIVPMVNADNNQHSPNENLRLDLYFQGIDFLENLFLSPYEKD